LPLKTARIREKKVVSFPLWSPGEPFVEFNVFAFGTDASGNDVGLQYAIRKTTTPEAFLQRDLEPLRERLVKMLLRDGLHIANESDLTLVRLALCPSDKAICDTILKSDADGLKAVLQQPDERSALVLLVAAAIAFNSERLEESALLFYAGQLRLRFDEHCFPPKPIDGQNPIHLMRGYAAEPRPMNLRREKRAVTAASLPNDESIVQPTFLVPSTCRGS